MQEETQGRYGEELEAPVKDPSVRLEKQRRQGIEGREGHDRRRAIGEMEGEGPQREESHGGHGEEGSMEGGGEEHGGRRRGSWET